MNHSTPGCNPRSMVIQIGDEMFIFLVPESYEAVDIFSLFISCPGNTARHSLNNSSVEKADGSVWS